MEAVSLVKMRTILLTCTVVCAPDRPARNASITQIDLALRFEVQWLEAETKRVNTLPMTCSDTAWHTRLSTHRFCVRETGAEFTNDQLQQVAEDIAAEARVSAYPR